MVNFQQLEVIVVSAKGTNDVAVSAPMAERTVKLN